MTRIIKNLFALLVIVVGGLWSLQGMGIVGDSFMSGQPQWIYAGIVAVLIGLAGLVWANRRRA